MCKFKFFICLLLSIILLYGCATFYNPATEKKETVFLDSATEAALGRDISLEVERKFKLDDSLKNKKRVGSIGRRIVTICDRQDLNYEFKVIKDEQMNAFALPGGFIYLNSGLLEQTHDDELACVIAHEIGHIVARHGVKKLQAQLGFDLLLGIVFRQQSQEELKRLLNVSFELISLGYSRDDEYQADRLGVKYAYDSGYDPAGMVSLFE
ncbi:MAG: M48 family metalloprotease, partial [Gammaproteobacteria bacterium]|nr:M48 family metalloprotease [Gammaproteobacteria bacterium]